MQRIIGPYGAQHHYSYVTVLSRCGDPTVVGNTSPTAASGNRILTALMNMVASILFEYRSKTVKRATDLKDSAEQHHSIYRAIREHDPESARQAMRHHLVATQQAQRLEVEQNTIDNENARNGRKK